MNIIRNARLKRQGNYDKLRDIKENTHDNMSCNRKGGVVYVWFNIWKII